jgi:hypothetical protein
VAEMSVGTGNFAIATFVNADGTKEVLDTELPNLLLNVKVLPKGKSAKAKAVRKKPAARKSRNKLSSDENNEKDDEQEEAEEEEKEEEEDAVDQETVEEIAPTIAYPSPPPPAEEAAQADDPQSVRRLYGLMKREKPKTTEYGGGYKLRITIAAAKAYITIQGKDDDKPTLLVGVEKNMATAKGKDMADVILSLWDVILAELIVDKQKALDKRKILLEG